MRTIIFATFLLFTLTACEDDQVSTNTHSETVNTFLTVADGWRIAEFIEEGTNKTSLFSPYRFVFTTDGTVTALSAEQTIKGTYLIFHDDGRTELEMNFLNAPTFYELNDDWYFIEQIENTIRFDDDGDLLLFQQQ